MVTVLMYLLTVHVLHVLHKIVHLIYTSGGDNV